MTQTLLNGFDIGLKTSSLTKASDVKIKNSRKYLFSYDGLNKLFGSGIVKGMTFTLSAEAGCGKTTFLLQTLEDYKTKHRHHKVAFLSNEESQEQLAEKCKRLGVRKIDIAHASDIEFILNTIENYDFVVIDSLQGIKGANEKAVISNIVSVAKKNKCCVGVITHRTKDDKEKGDSAIGHIVDTCFHMHQIHSNLTTNRKVCIRSSKNRFGALGYITSEMADSGFEMYLTENFFQNFTEDVLHEIL